jgi:hypothetical protein
MLKLLLDEHISPSVAVGLHRRMESFPVCALLEWEGGSLMGQDDATCLIQAAKLGWTRLTYDRRTIPPLLKNWAEYGRSHGGVIFVDEKTVPPSDIDGLVHAIEALATQSAQLDWTGRICFMRR